jgi:ubiquinone/menaquinone biosynthesis C-methylase UbiE
MRGEYGMKATSDKQPKRMSNASFKLMNLIMDAQDFLNPHIDTRVKTFGIAEGMIVVDYGCGPGRYTLRLSKLVGDKGKAYAVDLHELAIEAVKQKTKKFNLRSVEPVLARGYNSGLPSHVAAIVTAIDMFHSIPEPTSFLKEVHRIAKKEGFLIIDNGHQSRKTAKEKILSSKLWEIVDETADHLTCRPI